LLPVRKPTCFRRENHWLPVRKPTCFGRENHLLLGNLIASDERNTCYLSENLFASEERTTCYLSENLFLPKGKYMLHAARDSLALSKRTIQKSSLAEAGSHEKYTGRGTFLYTYGKEVLWTSERQLFCYPIVGKIYWGDALHM